ncbi:MAG TPA: CsbD family protein [Anaerolineae bacterium]
MNRDVFEGKWKQFRGKVKQAWGDLTDDELDRVQGDYEEFVGLLQEKYGWERERAEAEIEAEFERLSFD